ncbi:hypothetical protein K493DRAFT_320250 [Basidiobolus meristosporus CBS 931.73]|uniref:Arrestin C-terminal-like domain-containing protein n=1 Tax=Basidiobolus meristosporus CBS 931.73 TaxID=1314790 RepID=A0A1Y1XCU7_9FUNG|nr:hypothetical protein K493DRAFT_320250 [Basidiobolus meristosporus CBS 931.73]|eukprot:ORX83512.1 hypothetical protein K493DRAFT_320250 [Basidiobolus meristosporus CBS 931.73]
MFSSSSLDIYLQSDTLYSNPYHHEDASPLSLRGSVVLNTNSAVKIKQIYLQFSGKLSMMFPAAIKKTRRNLIQQTVVLFGDQEKMTPISGRHTFPFEILLPNDLPESFQQGFGKIKYTLKAVAETSFISSDLKSEVPVYVHRNGAALEEPTEEYSLEKSLASKLSCKISLPTVNYTPGEKFDVQVSATALDSDLRVTNVNCSLKEFAHFRVPSKSDHTRVLVAEYVNRLGFASTHFNADEQTKTIVMKTPEDASLSCANHLVDITHELLIRVYFEQAAGGIDYFTIHVPIDVVSQTITSELDQLPVYRPVELPPTYKSCVEEIALPPAYCSVA